MDERSLQYSRTANAEFLELPYAKSPVSMILILPSETSSLAEFEKVATHAILAEGISKLAPNMVAVSLPRFGLSYRCDLKDELVSMGMNQPFAPGVADFSGMTAEARLFIRKVIHAANIDVDEDGTVAAAAVIAGWSDDGDGVHFNANRPFLFLIRDRETDSILFMGRVADPSVK